MQTHKICMDHGMEMLMSAGDVKGVSKVHSYVYYASGAHLDCLDSVPDSAIQRRAEMWTVGIRWAFLELILAERLETRTGGRFAFNFNYFPPSSSAVHLLLTVSRVWF